MEYLVLRTFRSYGVTLRKGEVVDESAIRSPWLRRSEGKIIPAVEEPLEATNPAVISSGEPEQPVVAAPTVQDPPPNKEVKKESKPKGKSTRLSFGN